MRLFLTNLLLCATGIAAPVPVEAKKTPLDKMQGKWIIVTVDRGNGPNAPMGDFATYTLTIEGNKLSTATTLAPAYDKLPVKCDFKTEPMRIDVQFGGDKTLPGIFKLDDGKLYWCHARPGEPRPTEFKGDSEECITCFVWQRADK